MIQQILMRNSRLEHGNHEESESTPQSTSTESMRSGPRKSLQESDPGSAVLSTTSHREAVRSGSAAANKIVRRNSPPSAGLARVGEPETNSIIAQEPASHPRPGRSERESLDVDDRLGRRFFAMRSDIPRSQRIRNGLVDFSMAYDFHQGSR